MRRSTLAPTPKVAAAALALSALAAPAAAAIIEVDGGFGAGSATRDTLAGLDWLDVPIGASIDLDALNTRLTSGDLVGWRLATQAEVETFWGNAGIVVTDDTGLYIYTVDAAQVAATLTLFDLVGGTSFNSSFDFAEGWTAESSSATQQLGAVLARGYDGQDGYDSSGAILGATFPKTPSVGDGPGAWLVRDVPGPVPVPAPGALGLIGLGALAMAARRRR